MHQPSRPVSRGSRTSTDGDTWVGQPARSGHPHGSKHAGRQFNDVPRSEQRYRDAQPARRRRPGAGTAGRQRHPERGGTWARLIHGEARFCGLRPYRLGPGPRRGAVLRPPPLPPGPARVTRSTRAGSLTTCRGRSRGHGRLSPAGPGACARASRATRRSEADRRARSCPSDDRAAVPRGRAGRPPPRGAVGAPAGTPLRGTVPRPAACARGSGGACASPCDTLGKPR